jgi:four helix bundle protein
VQLIEGIPQSQGRTIAAQIVRAGTSVGANYRAACRAKSDRDFINKLTILEEEADETAFWLEMLMESSLLNNEQTQRLHKEASELAAIFVASANTVKARIRKDN